MRRGSGYDHWHSYLGIVEQLTAMIFYIRNAQLKPSLKNGPAAITFVVLLSHVAHVDSVYADDHDTVEGPRRTVGPDSAGRSTPSSEPESSSSATTAPREHASISACSAEQQAKRTRVGWAGGTLLSLGTISAAVAFLPPLLDSDHGRIVGPLSTLPLITGIGLLARYRTICVDERLAADPQARVRRKRWLLGFGWGLMAAGAGLFAAGFIQNSFAGLIIMPSIGGGLGIIGLGLLIRGYRVSGLEADPVEVRLGPTGVTLRTRF